MKKFIPFLFILFLGCETTEMIDYDLYEKSIYPTRTWIGWMCFPPSMAEDSLEFSLTVDVCQDYGDSLVLCGTAKFRGAKYMMTVNGYEKNDTLHLRFIDCVGGVTVIDDAVEDGEILYGTLDYYFVICRWGWINMTRYYVKF